jgi:pyruvate kinase
MVQLMPKAKIICTLGPSSETPAILEAMVRAGMNVARLNFSHGTHEEHARRVRNLRSAAKRAGRDVAILQDVQGPKIRLGEFEGGQLEVKTGQKVILTTRAVKGSGDVIPARLPTLIRDVLVGDPILLDDGRVRLEVLAIQGKNVQARVITGGILKDRKGLNLPRSRVSVSSLTAKDLVDLQFGKKLGVDYVALSFVRGPQEIELARKKLGAGGVPIIAKIEKPQAVESLNEIALAADGVMVARGDLGVEMPLESLPALQKHMVTQVNTLGRLTIVATEMLESMITQPRPTRAEVSDVANAVFDGADAVMLSGETAAGKFPVEATDSMRRIIEAAEAEPRERKPSPFLGSHDVSTGVAAAAMAAASQLKVDTIIAYTESGHTARLISEYRPRARILALTPNEEVVRRVQLYWGVEGRKVGRLHSTDAMVAQVRRICRDDKGCLRGKPVIIVAGVPLNVPGNTNLMTVHTV